MHLLLQEEKLEGMRNDFAFYHNLYKSYAISIPPLCIQRERDHNRFIFIIFKCAKINYLVQIIYF